MLVLFPKVQFVILSFITSPQFNTSGSSVAFGERVSFQLSSSDELGNFRETVWSVKAPLEDQVSDLLLSLLLQIQ